ncbi:MAG: hypothetical protein DLM72_16070 [Candidatus Nitrosopolaris wilkensis]|nr:MAG: hypothetical protein DLM72_16070 [Candidatus Nitrosopolaris wilkensis]
MITNVGALIAMIVGVINIFTFRQLWIIFAVAAIMISLVAYTVLEKRKLKQKQALNNESS